MPTKKSTKTAKTAKATAPTKRAKTPVRHAYSKHPVSITTSTSFGDLDPDDILLLELNRAIYGVFDRLGRPANPNERYILSRKAARAVLAMTDR